MTVDPPLPEEQVRGGGLERLLPWTWKAEQLAAVVHV
jgi:hypothetical protein